MSLYGTQLMKEPRKRTSNSKSLVVYSNSGLGKSNLFKNAPHALYMNLENRLSHIEGTFKEERITEIVEFRNKIKKIADEVKTINKLKDAIDNKDNQRIEIAKKKLKESYKDYEECANGKAPYVKLLVIDSTDDIYSMIESEVKVEMKIDDLADADRNRAYGRAKNRLLQEVRNCMNVGINVVFLCGIVKGNEAWNTEDKDIPFIGSGTAYKAMARKVTAVFSIDEESDGQRYIYTNPKNKRFYIKNSFDDFDNSIKLPDKIKLDFEELNKWIKFYTIEELNEWKKLHKLKKL